MEKHFVMFDLGSRNYGADVASVVRAGQISEINNSPKSPSYIEGQLRLGGCDMPVVDLRRWFGINSRENNEESCILVVNINGMKIGMIVSAVTDVLAIDENKIKPPKKTKNLDCVIGFSKVNTQMVTLVNLDRVLSKEEKDQLELFQRRHLG